METDRQRHLRGTRQPDLTHAHTASAPISARPIAPAPAPPAPRPPPLANTAPDADDTTAELAVVASGEAEAEAEAEAEGSEVAVAVTVTVIMAGVEVVVRLLRKQRLGQLGSDYCLHSY